MDVVIRGKNVKVSQSLRTATEEHIAKLDRYANGFARAEVDFSEERNPRIADRQKCEVLVHVKGHLLKAHASASEPFAALYDVCDKVEHQVKRWRFATPRTIWPEPCWVASGTDPLALAGDAFAGPRVEGAVLSGLAAADALLAP